MNGVLANNILVLKKKNTYEVYYSKAERIDVQIVLGKMSQLKSS